MSKIIKTDKTIQSPHGEIFGQFIQLDNDNKKPLIIISHGLGSSYEFGLRYADAFAEEGFAVYTFNFNGGQKTGDMTKMSLFTQVDDLKAVLDELKGVKLIDTNHLFLLGAS